MTSTVNMSHNATKKPRNINQMAAYIVLIGLAVAGAWSVNSIGINIPTLLQSADNAVNFVSHMFPLDFPPIGELTAMIVETLAIVFFGHRVGSRAFCSCFPLGSAADQPEYRGALALTCLYCVDARHPRPDFGYLIPPRLRSGVARRHLGHGAALHRHDRQAVFRCYRRA